jgi:microcystin degradation protein MlrC
MHANNQTGLETLANVITGYHTAPHEDVEETQLAAAAALIDMVRTGRRPHPQMVRVPMLLVGERAITSMEPLKTVFDRCAALEADGRIYAATLFVGMAWGDTPNTSVTVMVCPKDDADAAFARAEAAAIGRYLLEKRDTCPYAHPSYAPQEAVEKALCSANSPLLLSDSGDNPTAGGIGCNTVLLRLLRDAQTEKKVLFAPIYDETVVWDLRNTAPGTRLCVNIGMAQDADSAPVEMSCELIRFGEIYAYHELVYEKKADFVFLRSGNIDLVVCDHQLSFTGMECFETAGVAIGDYDIVVIKMGYVMPELRPHCREMIMALTPGRTPLTICADQYHNLPRPIWPLDQLEEGATVC